MYLPTTFDIHSNQQPTILLHTYLPTYQPAYYLTTTYLPTDCSWTVLDYYYLKGVQSILLQSFFHQFLSSHVQIRQWKALQWQAICSCTRPCFMLIFTDLRITAQMFFFSPWYPILLAWEEGTPECADLFWSGSRFKCLVLCFLFQLQV